MSWKQWVAAGLLSASLGWAPGASAGDLKINFPRRSHPTPVQRLNQEGVDAVNSQHFEKAESLFYKAYLLDPEDPFTLNNLGYISELQGQVDRAQQFYKLAGEQPSDAVIARASSRRVEGQTLNAALATPSTPLAATRDNVNAVRLLGQRRAPEVDLLLQQSLQRDPHNAFTLNNMGVAKEMEGETQEALKYYDAAAAAQSDAKAAVTSKKAYRGRPVSEMAAENASNLRRRLGSQRNVETQLGELNLRGVSAINRNDVRAAEKDFRSAYALDPFNAFALNNIGYVAELQGDSETAQFFYERARDAGGAKTRVGLATRQSAQGAPLFQVASDSDAQVETHVAQERDARRRQNAPIVLMHRDGTPVVETGQQ